MLHLSPFFFFPPTDEKKKRNHDGQSEERATARAGFLVKFEKTKEGKDDLSSQIFLNL